MKRTRVVVIGRPNVGKSTLFNRLVGRRRALVHDEPGVTRDRLEVETRWWVRSKPFNVTVVDTGGLGGERFADEIDKQVRIALDEADVVLLVFDGAAGLTPADEELIHNLNHSGLLSRLPVLGVVNKVDTDGHEGRINEFYSVGLDTLVTVSAEHDRGIDDLEEAVTKALGWDPSQVVVEEEVEEDEIVEETEVSVEGDELTEIEDEEPETERKIPRIAIVGRPNVGKSTMLNALVGRERMITSPIAGTTVDSVDSLVELGGRPYIFIDTAGIRRKSKTEQGVEVLSVVQARKALESADVAILVLDGETGTTDQDEKIAGLVQDSGVCVILVLNKWDTQVRGLPKSEEFTREMAAERVRKEMGFLPYAPILFTSAIHRKGFKGLPDLIDEILHQRKLKIPTHELTEWVRREAPIHNPQNAKFFLAHQSGRHPPTFVVHVNDPDRVHFSLRRHFVNALRERWGYMGSPVKMLFIEGHNRRSLPKPTRPPRPKLKPQSSST